MRIGLDDRVRVDYVQGERAQSATCFVLTSDGVHGVLRRAAPGDARARRRRAGGAARRWCEAALAGRQPRQRDRAGDPRARASTRAGWRTSCAAAADCPCRRALKLGDALDGYTSPRWWPTPASTGCTRRATRRAARWWRSRPCTRRAPATPRSARCWRTRPGWRLRVARTPRGEAGFVRVHEPRDAERALHRVRLARRPHAGAAAGNGRAASVSPRWSRRRIAIARALGRLHRHGRGPSRHQAGQPAPRRRRPLAHPRPRRRAVGPRAAPRSASCMPARRAT